MTDPIAFHFDFISPYAWPGAVGIEALAASHGRTVEWHPMLLGVSVMKTMGLPPLMETPLKGDYIRMDVPPIYRFHGIAYRPAVPDLVTSPFRPARLLCGLRPVPPAPAPSCKAASATARRTKSALPIPR